MPRCDVCNKLFASRQSLCNHRKRVHSKVPVPPGLRKSAVEDGARKAIDALFESPKKEKDRSPPVRKKTKVSKVAATIDTMLNGKLSKGVQNTSSTVGKKAKIDSIESDSDSGDSNHSDSGTEELSKDKKKQDSLLTDVFNKLYSNFDENDVEMRNDILTLLDALKARGCVTESEYADIKSHLERQMDLNLHESTESTIESMMQEAEKEVLGLLRSMSEKEARTLMALVKDYFEKEVELESVLLPARNLKDKLNALKIEIILKQIQKTRDRVIRVTNGSDKLDILNGLKAENLITDKQYEKLIIGPHTLPSISRIIQGKGMYLNRHWQY